MHILHLFVLLDYHTPYMEHETFWTLLADPAHWQFELFLIALFDGLIGVLIWPRLKRFFKHHESDDDRLDTLEKRLRDVENRT